MKRLLVLILTVMLSLDCLPALAEDVLLTEDGFLSPEWLEDEFICADSENGLWRYVTSDLSIRIERVIDAETPRVYYVADILASPENPLQTVITPGKRPGRTLKNPQTFAIESQAVLAITDDFSGYRIQKEQRVGIVIREGYVLSKKTRNSKNVRGWPNLDTLAVYADGSMKANASDTYTADEYLADGAVNVFAFGPMLVSNGELTGFVMEEDYYPYNEPRMAIGMIEPYHYMILCVEGREDNSKGARCGWMAEKMQSLGCVEALNLDGGGTAAMMFMGEVLNRSNKNMRSINSLIVFGKSEKVVAP